MVGQPLRLAPLRRHHIDVIVPFVLGGEGNEPSVRGEAGELLLAFIGRQADGRTTRGRDLPEISFRGEYDLAPADAGVAVEAIRRRVGRERGEARSQRQEWEGKGEGQEPGPWIHNNSFQSRKEPFSP